MRGFVTDIQRFSVHDGPGIRTTIFLQGCNMHCAWCHNPETIPPKSKLLFYEEKCIGCGTCYNICPKQAHKREGTTHRIDRSLCTDCGLCVSACCTQALTMSSLSLSVEDVMSEVLRDVDYYTNSGGGITLSGGECFVQFDFIFELLTVAKQYGLHTAVESNLYVDFDYIQKIAPFIDLFLVDVKLYSEDAHKQWTGLSNRKVLENLEKLDLLGLETIVRTPIIPSVADYTIEVEFIAKSIATLKHLKFYELLPYNPLSRVKYEALQHQYTIDDSVRHSMQEMVKLQEIAGRYVKTLIG